MHPFVLFLLLPLLAIAQESSGGNDGGNNSTTNNVQLSTSFTTFISINQDREQSTVTSAVVVTLTQDAPTSAQSGNSTVTSAPNNASGNATSSSSTIPLSTAATEGVIGGGGVNGAPAPGATDGGTVYGPDDDYISQAVLLARSSLFISLGGAVVGGLLVVL